MSAVYLAETADGRKVALKLMSFLLEDEPELLMRFRREAGVTLNLDHPNIVRTLGFGEEPDVGLYLVMELVEGENLRHRLVREGKLSPLDVRAIASQAAAALSYAHAHGVIHRDLKPENLLLDGNGNLKVADFGVARVEEGTRLTRTGVLPGTPEYMSPEQLSEETVTAAADIYGLATVVYEMLTGTTPFRSDNLARVIQRQVYEQPDAPSKKNPELSGAVNHVLLKALEKDPSKRHSSVDDFIKDFEAAWKVDPLDEKPTEPSGLSTVFVTWSPQERRRPWYHWLLPWSLAAVAMAVWLYRPAPSEPPLWLKEGVGWMAVPVGGTLHGALVWNGIEVALFEPRRGRSGAERARLAANLFSQRVREGKLVSPGEIKGEISGDDYVLRDTQELVRVTPELAQSVGTDKKQVGEYWLALCKDVILIREGHEPRYLQDFERDSPLRLDGSAPRYPLLDRVQQRAKLLVREPGPLPTSSFLDGLASLPREDRYRLQEAARFVPRPVKKK